MNKFWLDDLCAGTTVASTGINNLSHQNTQQPKTAPSHRVHGSEYSWKRVLISTM